MASAPLAFAAILTGAVTLDYGVKHLRTGFAGSSAAGSATVSSSGGAGTLSPAAKGKLNANQQAFAQRLQADTGLDPAVIAGWLISEEPASASAAPNGANNWLNIGAFDNSAWAFGGASVWSDPVTAADATASFMLGHAVNGVNAPASASSGIRGILSSVGKGVSAEIAAIQGSGWAGSGYPDLAGVVAGFQG